MEISATDLFDRLTERCSVCLTDTDRADAGVTVSSRRDRFVRYGIVCVVLSLSSPKCSFASAGHAVRHATVFAVSVLMAIVLAGMKG